MPDWKEIVEDQIIPNADRVKSLTHPLRDQFRIDYFTYHKIDQVGNYTVLLDRPDWAEKYVEEAIYEGDPYLRRFDNYQTGFCYIENHGSDAYKEMILKKGKEHCDFDKGILYIKRSPKAVEFFGFAGNTHHTHIDQLFLQQPWVFTTFASHFTRHLRPTLTHLDEVSNPLALLKGNDFFKREMVQSPTDRKTLLRFLEEIDEPTYRQFQTLSSQEQACLALSVDGETMRTIAARLFLSPRTVESYFESIKNKLSLSSKREIIQFARACRDIGLFQTLP